MKFKKTNLIIFAVIVLIVGVITSCSTPSQPNPIPYYKISDNFKSYCLFDTNSYWVYIDDATLVTDTVKINDIVETKRLNQDNVKFNYQAIEMLTNENYFGISNLEITAGEYEVKAGEMNSLLRMYKTDGSYHLVFLPQYPYGDEIIMGDDIGVYTNIEKIDSFELNNHTYNDVYHTRVVVSKNTVTEYNYWIAKNYGVIKIVKVSNGTTSSVSLQTSNLINRLI